MFSSSLSTGYSGVIDTSNVSSNLSTGTISDPEGSNVLSASSHLSSGSKFDSETSTVSKTDSDYDSMQ